MEKDLDEEEQRAGKIEVSSESGAAIGEPVDNLEFLREVDEHQAMLAENMKRAELLAHKMYDDAARRRREARSRAKDALLAAAAAETAAANRQIDNLKREVALRLASSTRPTSAAVENAGGLRMEDAAAAEVGN